MTTEKVYRRVLRRETHAPRTAPAVIVALVVLLFALALLVGGVWWWIDAGFREFTDARLTEVVSLVAQPSVLIGTGAVAVLIAVVLLVLALSPGRRARRARVTDRVALLVDDGVLADAVADAVALRERVDRSQVSVTLGKKTATVRITPTSGVPVDTDRAGRAAVEALASLGFSAAPRVLLSQTGVVA